MNNEYGNITNLIMLLGAILPDFLSAQKLFRVKPAAVRTIYAHDSLNSQSPPPHGLIQGRAGQDGQKQ